MSWYDRIWYDNLKKLQKIQSKNQLIGMLHIQNSHDSKSFMCVFFIHLAARFPTLHPKHLTTSPARGCFRSARNVASLRSCGGWSVWASSNARRASDDPQSTECPDGHFAKVGTRHLPDSKRWVSSEMGDLGWSKGHLWKDGEIRYVLVCCKSIGNKQSVTAKVAALLSKMSCEWKW